MTNTAKIDGKTARTYQDGKVFHKAEVSKGGKEAIQKQSVQIAQEHRECGDIKSREESSQPSIEDEYSGDEYYDEEESPGGSRREPIGYIGSDENDNKRVLN